jgi:hypothetical protein
MTSVPHVFDGEVFVSVTRKKKQERREKNVKRKKRSKLKEFVAFVFGWRFDLMIMRRGRFFFSIMKYR